MSAPAQPSSAPSPKVSRHSRRPSLGILIAVTAIGPMALNIFIPSMPGVTTVFASDYGTIQLTLTLYLFGVAVAQLLMGPLSDRFGRRPVLLGGIAVFLAGSLLGAFATSVATLILARIIQAVGGCAGLVLGRAIVRDMHDREKSASMIGYITMVMVVAPMIAPLLGGHLDQWFGWRATFITMLAIAAVVLVFAWALLGETHHNRHSSTTPVAMLCGFARLLRDAAFTGYAINVSCTTAVFFAFLAGAPYIMVEIMGRPSSEYGQYFVLNAASYMVGNFLSGWLSSRIGGERMIASGCLLALSGAALLTALALRGNMIPLALFGPVMLVGLGNGLSLPNATAAAISLRPELAGTASGLLGFLQMAVGALATLIVGKLQDDSVFPMVAVMSAAALLALLGFGLARIAAAPQTALAATPESD